MGNYFQDSIKRFFLRIDKIDADLASFAQNISGKRNDVFKALSNFEAESERMANTIAKISNNDSPVEKSCSVAIEGFKNNILEWHKRIEQDKRGTEFMHTHEKKLVVMVFGAVKTGKSTLGNFFAGREFLSAAFDNEFKHRPATEFATEEKGRVVGGVYKDAQGRNWFSEGLTDTTGSIQYFTLSGLRWMDSPGTGALKLEGDIRNMEEMVNEYLPYTDLCVFLMNSSEPGLQADMKYIDKLSREGQEALIVITKSDFCDEDVNDEGEIVSTWVPKDVKTRRLQEDDICARLKQQYPNISADKYRALSLSSYLAKQAVEKNDEKLYRESNLDKFMDILSEKASANVVAFKERQPKVKLNNFIHSIVDGNEEIAGIVSLESSLQFVLDNINDFKESVEKRAARIQKNIFAEVSRRVAKSVSSWELEVASGKSLNSKELSNRIANIVNECFTEQYNKSVGEFIDGYKSQFEANISIEVDAEFKKERKTLTQTYLESYVSERSPRGFFEHVGSFFGKSYYTSGTRERTITTEVELGTNLEDVIESIQKSLEPVVKQRILNELKKLQELYFLPQENYILSMKAQLAALKSTLLSLEYK